MLHCIILTQMQYILYELQKIGVLTFLQDPSEVSLG
jgi:hypothetical protein